MSGQLGRAEPMTNRYKLPEVITVTEDQLAGRLFVAYTGDASESEVLRRTGKSVRQHYETAMTVAREVFRVHRDDIKRKETKCRKRLS